MTKLRNMLQALKLAIDLHRHVKTGGIPQWTQEDSGELSRFIKSPAGRKLWVLLGQTVERRAIAACTTGGSAHDAGRVVGFREAMAVIEWLKAERTEDEISLKGDVEGVSSLFERYSP